MPLQWLFRVFYTLGILYLMIGDRRPLEKDVPLATPYRSSSSQQVQQCAFSCVCASHTDVYAVEMLQNTLPWNKLFALFDVLVVNRI